MNTFKISYFLSCCQGLLAAGHLRLGGHRAGASRLEPIQRNLDGSGRGILSYRSFRDELTEELMARACSRLVFLALLLSASLSFAGGPVPNVPIYMRIDNGWKGLYPLEDDYAEYSFRGSEVKLQDPYHVLLKPSVGMMVTFADKKQFASGNDLLSDHLQWELAYWSKHAGRVESAPRDDLGGMRNDLKVTELRLYNNQGGRINVYLIALATPQGVLAIAVSSPDDNLDPQVKEIAGSVKLVHRRLDPDEVKRLSLEARAKQ